MSDIHDGMRVAVILDGKLHDTGRFMGCKPHGSRSRIIVSSDFLGGKEVEFGFVRTFRTDGVWDVVVEFVEPCPNFLHYPRWPIRCYQIEGLD